MNRHFWTYYNIREGMLDDGGNVGFLAMLELWGRARTTIFARELGDLGSYLIQLSAFQHFEAEKH